MSIRKNLMSVLIGLSTFSMFSGVINASAVEERLWGNYQEHRELGVQEKEQLFHYLASDEFLDNKVTELSRQQMSIWRQAMSEYRNMLNNQ